MSFKTLNIGATALLTQKRALDTVGQNIANAATPGYSRQRVKTEAISPEIHTFGALGSGVRIMSIKRIADDFLDKQVRIAKGTMESLNAFDNAYETMQVVFNELTDNDLSSTMNEFWNAVSDLSNNVEDISTRRAVIENAKTLRDRFEIMEQQIRNLRLHQNEALVDTVGRVNSLLIEVAQLNLDIVRVESGGVTGVVANDLRDQRGERLKELASIMDIKVSAQPNGSVVVTQKTRLLVMDNEYFALSTRSSNSDDIMIETPVFLSDDSDVILGDGLMFAQVEIRDRMLMDFKRDIDQLAASFAWEFNRIHSQGVGLNGFNSITGTTSVVDPNLDLDQLQFEFTPKPGTYQIVNGNVEIIVHNTISGNDTTVNIEIDLDNNPIDPDTILYDPGNPTAANALVNKLQAAFDSVRIGVFTVGLGLSNRLQISSNTAEFTFGFGRDTSGVLATLGVNTFFTASDAGNFDVNTMIDNNPDLIAGAREFTPGDNTGALALLALRETGVLSNKVATLDDFYEGIVGRLGIEGARIKSLQETQADILMRMENQREELSGVNLDEELTKMIQFQRSFQSAARFISTADTILETLINM